MATVEAEDLLRDGSVTVQGLLKEFGIGRTRAYELMGTGQLAYTQLGARRLIPRAAVRRLLAAGLVGVSSTATPTA